MEKDKCELCGSELEENINSCSYCNWPCPSLIKESPKLIKREQEMLEVTKKYWNGWRSTYNEYLKLSKENSDIKKDLKEIYFKLQDTDEKIGFSHNDSIYEFNQEVDEQYTLSLSSTELKSDVSKSDNNSLLSPEIENVKNDKEATDLVEKYNQQFEFIDKIEVSETTDSKLHRRDRESSPIFERTNRGDYWLINNSYLVPKRNHKINQHSYETFSELFECKKYNQSFSGKFLLIKPAKVTCFHNEEIWQLEERGITEFV
ncbi:MAG: hypothetical protein RMY34_08150 [Aulosira sp. DedQUE10]|nr:hypothetical protein [Aulosira sp. DedQUE10]